MASNIKLSADLERKFVEYKRSKNDIRALAFMIAGAADYEASRLYLRMSSSRGGFHKTLAFFDKMMMPRSKEFHRASSRDAYRVKDELDKAISRYTDEAIAAYGYGGIHPMISVSGVYRGHFPAGVKERLRFLHMGRNLLSDVAELHRVISKTRSPSVGP